MDTTTTPLFRAHEVARLAGVSFRQIDYWCRRGVITPAVEANGSGTQRRFTLRQASALRVLGRLRKSGIDLDRMRLVARALEGADALDGWLVAPLRDHPPVIVDDGDLPLLLGQLGAALVLELPGEAQAEPEGERRRHGHDGHEREG